MTDAKFQRGDRVEKIGGSSWHGRVVGFYSTDQTAEGYAVESEREPGSVQIYPVKALRKIMADADREAKAREVYQDCWHKAHSHPRSQRIKVKPPAHAIAAMLAFADATRPQVSDGRLKQAAEESAILINEVNERSSSRQFYDINQVLHAKLATVRATLVRALRTQPPQAMTREEHRLEDLKQQTAYTGPVVSFDVQAPYYIASCDHCGWVGSSETCGTDSFGDDSDVYCPRCQSSGADCGKIAERIGSQPSQATPDTPVREIMRPGGRPTFVSDNETALSLFGQTSEIAGNRGVSTELLAQDTGFAMVGATPVDEAGLREAVRSLLPTGNDKLPGDRVVPIYVRMDELRALHALAAHPIARADEQGVEALKQAILAECAKRGGSCNGTPSGLLAINVEVEPVEVVRAVIDAVQPTSPAPHP